MSTVSVNGKTYVGNNISISNGKVYIDGRVYEGDKNEKNINITVNGNVENLSVDVCDKLIVSGDAGKVKSTSGDIIIKGNVGGNVKSTSGNISCGNVSGNVKTTSGNIKRKLL